MKEKDLIDRLNSNVNKTEGNKYSFNKGTKVSIPVSVKKSEKQCNKDCDKKECTCNNEKKARTFDDLVNEKSKKLCSLDGDKIYEIDNKTSDKILNDNLSKFINNNKASFNEIPKIIKRCNEIHDNKEEFPPIITATSTKDNRGIDLKFNEKKLEDMVRKYVEKYVNEKESEIELEDFDDNSLTEEVVREIVRNEVIDIVSDFLSLLIDG